MIHEIIDRWTSYFQSRRELKSYTINYDSVNVGAVSSNGYNVIFVPFAKTNKQMPESEGRYPSYDIVVRVIASGSSEEDASRRAERLATKLEALFMANRKLFDRSKIFKGNAYYLNNTDVIGNAYPEDVRGITEGRSGTLQKEVDLFVRCYRDEYLNSIPGERPVKAPGDPDVPVDKDEYLGWYMPEDQSLYYSGLDPSKIKVSFSKENELAMVFDLDTGLIESN